MHRLLARAIYLGGLNKSFLNCLNSFMVPPSSISEVRKIVFLLPVWQLLLGIVVGFVFFLLAGVNAGIAGFYGACINFAGSLVFAFVIFGFGDKDPKNITRKMFRAEAYKVFTISMMFYYAVAVLALPFLPVIVGFIVTLIVFFVALLTVFR